MEEDKEQAYRARCAPASRYTRTVNSEWRTPRARHAGGSERRAHGQVTVAVVPWAGARLPALRERGDLGTRPIRGGRTSFLLAPR